MTTDTLLRAAGAAWATWACKRRKPPHVRPTQVGLKGPGGRLPGLFILSSAGQAVVKAGIDIHRLDAAFTPPSRVEC